MLSLSILMWPNSVQPLDLLQESKLLHVTVVIALFERCRAEIKPGSSSSLTFSNYITYNSFTIISDWLTLNIERKGEKLAKCKTISHEAN